MHNSLHFLEFYLFFTFMLPMHFVTYLANVMDIMVSTFLAHMYSELMVASLMVWFLVLYYSSIFFNDVEPF